jgi:amino acid adenylation domain-containing protein/FkbH-like protein/thioester reductase-like protein
MERANGSGVSRSEMQGNTMHSGLSMEAVSQSEAPLAEVAQTNATTLIAIAGTFTIEPLVSPLRFWIRTLQLDANVTVAAYGQVLQTLLNPESDFASNRSGLNVLLLRIEDWIRDRTKSSVADNVEQVRKMAEEIGAAAGHLQSRTNARLCVLFCPASSGLSEHYVQGFDTVERDLTATIASLPRTTCWKYPDVARLYPVAEIEDVRADQLGHIPYTIEFFTAVATFLARRITAEAKPRYKVVAVDCDNTLWRGICGEDGPEGVRITSLNRRLQEVLLRQCEAGMLVCLCSKNNASDVEAVFEAHPEMPLHRNNILSARVNWEPKSANLQALARELGLALDSFIFIDDSALECDEVRTHCPAVLTLQFPQTDQEAAHFLDHVWAFDNAGATQEAKRRTAQYRENRARGEALEGAQSFEQFLASLDLRVDIAPLQQRQLPRVAELVQRTNQFNLTGIRRGAGQIEDLWKSNDLQVDTICVTDRFGDYGLVGAVFSRLKPDAIEVDAFVLSCRALGRGVEHRLAGELGRRARESGISNVVFTFHPTSRNEPARIFLERSFATFEVSVPSGPDSQSKARVFVVPASYCEQLPSLRPVDPAALAEANEPTPSPAVTQSSSGHDWHAAAYRLSRINDIVREVNRTSVRRAMVSAEHVSPRTPMETALAALWTEVLSINEVGIHADFFQLGGDSLAAVRVISRIGSVLGFQLSLLEFLEQPTVAALAEKLESGARSVVGIERTDRSKPLPLSWAQQRMWFIDLVQEGAAAYKISRAVKLSGQLELRVLQAAFDDILRRHEALRTVFINQSGAPVQQVTASAHLLLEVEDIEHSHAQMLALLETDMAARFDLQRGPLIRARVFRLGAAEHLLLVTVHHIVADGWSMGVLLNELSALYAGHLAGASAIALPDLKIQYGDYVYWQQLQSHESQLHQQLEHWQQQLQGAPELLRLPTDQPRPLVQSYRGDAVHALVSAESVENLRALARRMNVTLPMALYAAWSIVLGRISGQDDIVVGMPVANRRDTQLEPLIGLFVNTVAVRVRLHESLTVEDLLLQLRETMFGAYANQDIPFEKVVEALHPARSSSYSPLVQVMLAVQNTPSGELRLPGITVAEQELPVRTAEFDLVLSLSESPAGIAATLIYATDLFAAQTVKRWLGYFVAALGDMTADPACALSRLRLMGDDERSKIVHDFNDSTIEFPKEQLVHELIASRAQQRPHAPALLHEGHSLTYAELDARARLLAEHLVALGVTPDQPVAVCLDRGMDLAVSVLAILKAGGAFLPLDPAYPPERLAYMVEDAAPSVVLVHPKFVEVLPKTAARLVLLEWGWPDALRISGAGGEYTPVRTTGKNLAYIIYTSGSTGMPKGVMVEHGGLLNLAHMQQRSLGVDEHSRVLQFASPSFDAFMWEYVMTLPFGACLCFASRDELAPGEPLYQTLRTFAITHVTLPPVALQAIPSSAGLQLLGTIVVAGEACPVGLAQQWGPGRRFINGYGPTEATVCATMYEWRSDIGETVPIGHPIPNARIYILDRNGEPVPIGVAGEIHIGGAGLARGYLHRQELTESRFVPDHFAPDSNSRLYKTGDLGRWRADGAIEFLGRNDDQVKIRGFRIELGEIETQLATHVAVKDAIVIARDGNGEKQLVAYVTRRDVATPSVEDLRAHLRAALPDHMIPSAFVALDTFKLSPNGKIDRRALPAPDIGAFVRHEYQAPEGRAEQTLVDIWRELLPIDQIGRLDSFFELGGHSLLAVKALARINEAFGCALQVTDLYRYPSVAELAPRISGTVAEDTIVDLAAEARLDDDITPSAVARHIPERHVLLTGATGFVGRVLLEKLLTGTTATIHCLVRGESRNEALTRIKETLIKWDLWRNEFAHRLVAVPGDLRRPLLGLDEATYASLCGSIDSIYHSATSMNHLESYAMARAANVEGAKGLVRFAARRRLKLINYLSTLGVFSAAPTDSPRIVHEDTSIEAEHQRASEGYLASKWVSEQIFMSAHERGVPCNIFRLGLIWADARTGRYDELQHGYRMLKSCLLSGFGIESYRYAMNPTPVDYAVNAVAFLANSHPHGGGRFHIASAWQPEEGLLERCNRIAGTALRLKSEYDWIREIKRLHREGRSLPAVPLIEYAFSMDRETFDQHQRDSHRRTTTISCERTHRELEAAGISTPHLDDCLLRLTVKSMLLRDAELRIARRSGAPWLALVDENENSECVEPPPAIRLEALQGLRS